MAKPDAPQPDFKAPRPPELLSPWRTDARAALQEEARAFARDVILPLADELDPRKGEMPRSLIDQMAAKGWFGITIPAEYGGMGLGVFEYCLVSEELARAWLSTGSILARGQGLGTQTLDDERRRALLAKSAKGQWIGSIALSEPTAGSDLAGVQTRAVREGDEWVLTGTKRWAGFAKGADFVEVLARVRDPEPGEPRSAGLEPFLVVKEPGTFPQGMTGTVIDKIGYHGFLTFELTLDGVRVPERDRLTGLYGDEGADADSGGFAAVQRGLNIARVHTAARAVGVARAAVEDCTAYLQEREQFGQPIGQFQALRFALADMAAEVAQARAYWQQVAHLLDEGLPAESESAAVKLLATEMAVRVTNQAMQLHGGNGYTTERRIERYWRDARLTTIFEGTSEIQRRIISDRMLPRG
ncbi:alkylation response protein AidB-like acyl-CoA dehydrogenase [Methylorubrum rhodesianum]|jgi:alkylation response protein AidB-like acyl-CoA dehydrogenase|uniref:Acyl-CoA dehydrogenase family protein n=2 Tax=Methylorubrum rhodesianum TaxID=29427 RepID=A0ABU9ZI79_9HYPH|nr:MULTISPECIES: acyl-CoA dehydrogenase family protein [Methylorubrum]MBB5765140.1 alkylation response protein AidB-like acyl-CoA dehydrogenase [Methylorubrum rhodesianum]MBI1687688.1 acyl-CoA dehydrogenase [Methylorubrum sp. DB1722]MBK3403555.1 acyl-CoA dehydrogenase family protein [Methylorubrum rhodesianum]MBY0141069.1 acyl-CoA dehydrogenase family protein [Methylorubrum populi]